MEKEITLEGMDTMVFRAARAGTNVKPDMLKGYFHGTISPQAPTGSQTVDEE